MKITNRTKIRVPRQWLQKVMDHLGVNPKIDIVYADNPEIVEIPNNKFDYKRDGKHCGHTNFLIDGIAIYEDNRVQLFVGSWRNGSFVNWTSNYVKWVLAHELRHHYYYYHRGNINYPFKGMSEVERQKREERGCNRFASLLVGVPYRDYDVHIKDGKVKNSTSAVPKRKRYISG
jgi:hypothetical protein